MDAPPYRKFIERLMEPFGQRITRRDVLRSTYGYTTCAILRVSGGNSSGAKRPMYDHARLSAAVWPWQQVLLELVGRTPGAKLGFGRLLD